ncbi:hypothetical protein FJY84_06740 [Candidatus Bathyarchaeota archaeon]|nr:hypothetical protein [Candidatus Bathyarchaeota archaeon]
MSISGSKSYYIIILTLSVIGAILFATTDFGGYLSYYAYSVSLETSFYNPDLKIYAPLFILATLFFLLNVFVSLKELGFIKSSFPKNSVKLG